MCEFCLKSPWPINEGTKPELIAEPIPDPEPETTFELPEVITITCQGLDLEGLFKLDTPNPTKTKDETEER